MIVCSFLPRPRNHDGPSDLVLNVDFRRNQARENGEWLFVVLEYIALESGQLAKSMDPASFLFFVVSTWIRVPGRARGNVSS